MATRVPIPTESGQSETRQTIHNVSSTNGSVSLAGTFQNVSIVSRQDVKIEKKMEENIKNIKDCREALLVSDPDLDRKALISAKGKRAPGTCEWIVEDPSYKSWLAREFPVLRISGGPGKGKTMLSLFLTERLATICQAKGDHLLSFYCRFQDDRFNDPRNVLRNIIYQLLEFNQHDCEQVKYVLKYFESPKRTNDILSSFEGLWEILHTLLSQPGLPTIWCIIDGIDECQSFERLQGRLYEYCRRCHRQNGETRFQLLIVGRHNDDYDAAHVINLNVDQEKPDASDVDRSVTLSFKPLDQSRILCPDADGSNAAHIIKLDKDHGTRIKGDVECFIISSLKPLGRIPGFAQIRDDVVKILFERAEGTFLWVSFVIAELMRKQNCTQIKDTVKSFPEGLNPTFDRMLRGIDPNYHQASASILRWILFSRRPLTLEELAAAISTTTTGVHSKADADFTADIVQILKPLVQVQEEKVFFVHQSAKEYFIERAQYSKSPGDVYRFIFDQCNGIIAHRCLKVLERYSDRDTPRTRRSQHTNGYSRHSLFDYADKYWDYHTRVSATCSVDINRSFFENMVLQKKKIMLIRGHSIISQASALGIVRLLEALHRHRRLYWMINVSLDCPLLDAAMGGGDERTIKFLLEHGADSQAAMRQAFIQASESEQPATIRLLLEHGLVDRYTLTDKLHDSLFSALKHSNHLSKFRDDSMLYLHRRSSLDPKPLLVSAVGLECKATVQILLNHRADFKSAITWRRHYALFTAVSTRNLSILELLLDHGADIEARNYSGETALFKAASEGALTYTYYDKYPEKEVSDYDPAELLMKPGGENAEKKPKRMASKLQFDIVQYLLKRGANVEAIGFRGMTPLLSAAIDGTIDILRCLLNHGADINAKDHANETALIKAIVRGDEDILEYLLSCGAATDVVAESNRPLILSATKHGSERILNFLFQKRADINGKSSDGHTPLVSALARCMYSRNFDINLSFRRLIGAEDVADKSIRPGFFLDSIWDWSWLWRKLPKQPEEMVKWLLSHGADTNLCGRVYLYEPLLPFGTEGWTIRRSLDERVGWVVLDVPPLICAANIGLDWAIHLLAKRGADFDAKATELLLGKRMRDNFVPSFIKRRQERSERNDAFVKLDPMDQGPRPNSSRPLTEHVRTRKAGSALVYASMAGSLTTVRLLLSFGADTGIEDGFGMTALMWARKKGFDEIAKVLEAHDECRTSSFV